MMLGCSILIDFRIPNFKLTMKMSVWFWLLALNYYGMTSAVVLISAYTPISANITQPSPSLSCPTNASSSAPLIVLFNNTIAFAGGLYFIYSCCCDCAKYGRIPMFLRECSVENATKISLMKVLSTSQMALVSQVVYLALLNTKELHATGKCSQEQLVALSERLVSPCHMYAVGLHLTSETSAAMTEVVDPPKCCCCAPLSRCSYVWTIVKNIFALHLWGKYEM